SFPQQKSSQLKVLNTSVSSILTEEFRLANSYSFEVLNLGASSFVFNIPPQVQFLGSYINNKPVKPFRNDKAQIAVNLPKDKNLTIAIKTLETLPESHQLSLYLPTKERSLKTKWDFYYPKALDIQATESNLNFRKTEELNPIKNYAHNVLSKFFISSGSTFMMAGICIIPLLILAFCLKICLWIYQKSKASDKKVTFKNIFILIGGIALVLFCIALAIPNFRSARSSQPRYQSKNKMPSPSSIVGALGGWAQEADMMNELEEEIQLKDGFADEADDHMSMDKISNSKALQSAVYAPPSNALRFNGSRRPSAQKQKRDRRYAKSKGLFDQRSKESSRSFKKYKRKAIKREKASKYKKIRKSGVKPVEIQFPKLSNSIRFQKATPIDGLVYINLSINKAKSNSFLLTSSIFALIYLALFIYLEKHQKLILIAFLSILMILSPAGQLMFMRPEPLFFVLAVILLNSISRICQNSLLILVILFSLNTTEARKSNYYAKPSQAKVFRVFDFKKNDFTYKDQILVQDQLIQKLKKKAVTPQINANILSQKIKLQPDFKNKKLRIIYSYQISDQHSSRFELLKISDKTLIEECFDENAKTIDLEKSPHRGHSPLFVKNLKGNKITLILELPLNSKNYGDDFYREIAISLAPNSSILYQREQYYLKIDHSLFKDGLYYTSAKSNRIFLHFRKTSFQTKRTPSPIQYNVAIKNTYNRVKVPKKSRIKFQQKVSFSEPYIIVKNSVSISNQNQFQLRLPQGATLSQFQIHRNYQSLKQGKDFSLEQKNNHLMVQVLGSSHQLNLSYRYFLNKTANHFHLPFLAEQFKENIFTLEKESKEGQDIQFEVNESLLETASNTYQRKVQEFENIPSSLNAKSQFSVEIKTKSFVSFSKTKCLSYKIENFLVSKKEIYQKLVLTLSNKESQFLELELPEGTVLEEALIDDQHLNIVAKDQKSLLLPLKKYKNQRNFNITLLFKAKLNFQDDKYKILLPRLHTDIKKLHFALTSDQNIYKFSDENPLRIQNSHGMNAFKQWVTSKNSFHFSFPRGRYFYTGSREGVETEIEIEFEEIPEKKEEVASSLELTPLFLIFVLAIFYQLSLNSPRFKIALLILSFFLVSSFSSTLQFFYLTLLIAYMGYINSSSSLE
ncbi:hypothetical protein MJH12_14195, partial [bacterium]|nr:hypothetical protein [bacterium]